VECPLSLVRKSEFAEMRGVSPGRVSQWIAAGQIDGAAIVGSGQRALINVEIACAQLQERLAVDERFGLNGLSTNLEAAARRPPPRFASSRKVRPKAPSRPGSRQRSSSRPNS
jgi:hypothetical protein